MAMFYPFQLLQARGLAGPLARRLACPPWREDRRRSV